MTKHSATINEVDNSMKQSLHWRLLDIYIRTYMHSELNTKLQVKYPVLKL